jgi:predicted ester cyclase
LALSTQELRAINDRFFEEVINNRNFSIMEEFIAPEYIMHGAQSPVEGPDGFRQLGERVLTTFPDIHFTVDDFITDGEKMVVRWTARATHLGAFGPHPPSGKQVSWSGVSITRVNSEGMSVEDWQVEDTLAILMQIGAVPQPAQTTA